MEKDLAALFARTQIVETINRLFIGTDSRESYDRFWCMAMS